VFRLTETESLMRTIFATAAVCLFLVVGIVGAASQNMIFRPALDAIGNAEPPTSENAQVPPDAGLDSGDEQVLPGRRGRVIVKSGTPKPPKRGFERRKMGKSSGS
jgi:hypothetical protein